MYAVYIYHSFFSYMLSKMLEILTQPISFIFAGEITGNKLQIDARLQHTWVF